MIPIGFFFKDGSCGTDQVQYWMPEALASTSHMQPPNWWRKRTSDGAEGSKSMGEWETHPKLLSLSVETIDLHAPSAVRSWSAQVYTQENKLPDGGGPSITPRSSSFAAASEVTMDGVCSHRNG